MKTFKTLLRLLGFSLFVILAVVFCLNSAFAVEEDEIPEEDEVEKNLKKGISVDSERGLFDKVKDFFKGYDKEKAEFENRETVKQEFKDELGREMTIEEEKQIFDREDDGKYHGSDRDYALEIAGRERERAVREYNREHSEQDYEIDTNKEIDYDREAAEREREANSMEREYGREEPERNVEVERDTNRESDADREAAERERQANMMEGGY